MGPLVSILIPAFNAEPWIADTIESALGQTWPNKEVIVINDGSTDRTLAIANQFVARGVTVFSQTNQGAAAARNQALKTSKGDYIQWLDADDLLAPDKIEKQLDALQRCPGKRTLLSSAWGKFYHRVERARFVPTSIWCDLTPLEFLLRKMEQGPFMQTTAWLVSRELTEAAGPWNTRLLGDDDGEYFCRVILGSERILFVPEAKAFWRVSGWNSLSNVGVCREKITAHFLAMELQIKHLRSIENSSRVRGAIVGCLQASLQYFYPEWPDLIKRMEELAAEVGGRLEAPRLPWKYSLLQKMFGWSVAKRARFMLPTIRKGLVRKWDRGMYLIEKSRHSRNRAVSGSAAHAYNPGSGG